jgi:hypothetical protein
MQQSKSIAQETLHEIIRRIITVVQPEKIILLFAGLRTNQRR